MLVGKAAAPRATARRRVEPDRPGLASRTSAVLDLQRRAGNRASTLWLQRAGCCAGCGSGGPCDEQEAPAGAVVQRVVTDKPTVQQGSVGPAVTDLQQSLNGAMGAGLQPDGRFGRMTDGAVRAFQGDRGLDIDGIVGPDTWSAFDQQTTQAPPAPGKETDPANDFRIRGLPEDRLDHPDRIFFDFASPAVPAVEEAKVAALALPPTRPLALHGSSSEEGSGNTTLTNQRIGSVSTLLAEHGHAAARAPSNETPGAVGKIDYRSARVVLVAPAGAPGLASCVGRSGAETCPPSVPAAFDRADALLGQAVGKLATPGSLTADERRLVSALFRDDSDGAIAEVRQNMGDLRAHLSNVRQRRQEPGSADAPDTPFHRCGNECFSSCGSGSVAFNNGAGTSSTVTFCAEYTAMAAPKAGTGATVEESQEHILIHEGAHGTDSVRCGDFAKGTERAFALLSRDEALHNADSYTALARNLVRPGSASTRPVVADTGELAGAAGVQEPIAWLDRWLQAADFETADLYNAIKQLEGVRWTEVDDRSNLQASMALVAGEFPVTPPPAAPVRRDREKMAAIHDRYDRVRGVLNANTASLTLDRGAVLEWAPGPGRVVTIPAGFESLPIRERIELLTAALFRAFPDVRAGLDGNYARLAPRLCNKRTPGFAFSAG
jgi:hypothetical protein